MKSSDRPEMRRQLRKQLLTVKTLNDQERSKLNKTLQNLHQRQTASCNHLERQLDAVKQYNLFANQYLTDSVIDVHDLTADPIYTHGHVNVDKCELDLNKLLTQRQHNARQKALFLARAPPTSRGVEVWNTLPRAPCRCAGVCGQQCKHFPCVQPTTYQFLGMQRDMLQLYRHYADDLPEYKRKSLSSVASQSDFDTRTLIEHSQFLAQQKVAAFHPMERAKALKLQHHLMKEKMLADIPPPSNTLYGGPYPKRKSLKALWTR